MSLLPKKTRLLKGAGLMMLSILFLTACGDDKAPPVDSDDKKGEAAYKAKVDKGVSDSVVNSIVREWGISEEQAKCLLGDLRASQLGRADSDPAVQAVFEKCGVDPSVVDS